MFAVQFFLFFYAVCGLKDIRQMAFYSHWSRAVGEQECYKDREAFDQRRSVCLVQSPVSRHAWACPSSQAPLPH